MKNVLQHASAWMGLAAGGIMHGFCPALLSKPAETPMDSSDSQSCRAVHLLYSRVQLDLLDLASELAPPMCSRVRGNGHHRNRPTYWGVISPQSSLSIRSAYTLHRGSPHPLQGGNSIWTSCRHSSVSTGSPFSLSFPTHPCSFLS